MAQGRSSQRFEPTKESLMDNQDFLEGGFGAFDENEEQRMEQNLEAFDEQMELAKKYAKKLDGEEGTIAHEVMDDLLDRTWRQPTWNPQSQHPQQEAYMREGQKQIVAYILRQINRARTGQIGGRTRDQYAGQ